MSTINQLATSHYSKMRDRDELYRLYIIEGKTQSEIGKSYGVSNKRVSKWMIRFKIEAKKTSSGRKYIGRKLTQEHKDKLRQYRIGRVTPEATRLKIAKTIRESGIKAGKNNNWWKVANI